MLNRFAIAAVLSVLLVQAQAKPAERDYLRPGEENFSANYQVQYARAVRDVLSRAWREDVVLRVVDRPPFDAEWSTGISRAAGAYNVFVVSASRQVWESLGFGSVDRLKKTGSYRGVVPRLHERPLSPSLTARIATLCRAVLRDKRNYGGDDVIFMDANKFTFYLGFIPREHLTAHMTGWGPRTVHLLEVADALAAYARGGPETRLIQAVAKAERTLGI